MAYRNSLMKKLNLSKSALKKSKEAEQRQEATDGPNIADIMMDSRYLRQSASLINDALQKGFDVLQLSDGDIVMTGTKTIVHRYEWDGQKGKLARIKTEVSGPKLASVSPRKGKDKADADADMDAMEEV